MAVDLVVSSTQKRGSMAPVPPFYHWSDTGNAAERAENEKRKMGSLFTVGTFRSGSQTRLQHRLGTRASTTLRRYSLDGGGRTTTERERRAVLYTPRWAITVETPCRATASVKISRGSSRERRKHARRHDNNL